MTPTHADYALLSLCVWREARGEGQSGMTAVACVVRNRTQKHKSTFFEEVVKPWQFSSITAKGDGQLVVYPSTSSPIWIAACLIAENVIDGHVSDITNGATLYYDDSIEFPKSWNKDKVIPLGKIGRFFMFREVA